MNKEIEKALEQIAKEECYSIEARGGLDTRRLRQRGLLRGRRMVDSQNARKSLRTGQGKLLTERAFTA